MNKEEENENWDLVIEPQASLFSIDFKEIWRYRDLLRMFIKREIVQFYKQTILGPLWFFIQPLLTTIVFTIVFGNIANIPTGSDKPKILFYLAGIVLWNYFADALTSTAATFTTNASIFGKVYFPRIIMPLSKVLSNLLKLGIQLILFFAIYFFLVVSGKTDFSINVNILLFPLLVVILVGLGLGIGMIVSSMTTKYKDLTFLITFGVQLLMYITPIIYPISYFKGTKFYPLVAYNPISPAIETFKNSLLGGKVDYGMLLYSFVVSMIVFFIGLLIFNKTEKTFIDTV